MLSILINSVEIISAESSPKILQNISFKLDKGNIYTILGKNGSGKSTLINTITNLLDPNIFKIDADIVFNGIKIFEINNTELLQIRKEKIRYVFQDSVNSFNPLKKFDYYFNMLKVTNEECGELLDYFLLPPKDKLFNMYSYEVSGGMAQRISICYALLSKPQLLILDEPTSAIDINISNLLCNKLREFVSGNESSVLLITQDLDFAEHVSDYIAYMENGTLSAFISTEEYKNSSTENLKEEQS